jgi:hypothetical protein
MESMITVKVNKDKNGDGFIQLEQFNDLVNISKVKYYTFNRTNEYTKDQDISSLILLRFFDKNKKQIKCKSNNPNKEKK